jgi:DNA-binding MarR family transcriptional regulator
MEPSNPKLNPPRSKLGPTKILILRILENNGPQTVAQVRDAMRMSHTLINKSLNDLWQMGLVTQSFPKGLLNATWRIRE